MKKSKTPQCRAFWILVITVSLSVTAVSLYHAFDSFISEPSHVALTRQQTDEILYPPFKACFHHWMLWINWTAVEKDMNFTKEEVLFAVSYLTPVFAEEPFDEVAVEESFNLKLRANNLTIEQFYVNIAFRNMKIIKDVPEDDNKYEISVEEWPMYDNPNPKYWLCYQFSEDHVSALISHYENAGVDESSVDEIILRLNLRQFLLKTYMKPVWLTKYEYAAHVRAHPMKYTKDNVNLPFFGVSLYPNAYSKSSIGLAPNAARIAKIKINSYLWANNSAYPCVEGRQWIASNETCLQGCRTKFEIQKRGIVSKRNFSEFIHAPRNKITFKNFNESTRKAVLSYTSHLDFSEMNGNNNKTIRENVQSEYEECMKNCNLEIGCELWSYSFTKIFMSVVEMPAFALAYPSSVAAMMEVNLQTWENFTSNIGGLLGIWTGASVWTIFQIIYLCCSKAQTNNLENSTIKQKLTQKNDGVQETIFSSQALQPVDQLFVPVPHHPADIHHVPVYD